jgi:hypothetical protein
MNQPEKSVATDGLSGWYTTYLGHRILLNTSILVKRIICSLREATGIEFQSRITNKEGGIPRAVLEASHSFPEGNEQVPVQRQIRDFLLNDISLPGSLKA